MTGPPRSSPPIVLTTDFGLSDAFVGVMKGVILNINPHATIVDLTHDIGPQDLRQGSFVLGVNHTYFPVGTIHVAVVDPGVGTDRRAIVLETPSAIFVAPDNGLLSQVVQGFMESDHQLEGGHETAGLPPHLKAYELTNVQYRLNPVSNTFHGRDIFSPAAAHLSLGVGPEEMGPRVFRMVYRPLPKPTGQEQSVVGEVIYVDRFGNLVTNISSASMVSHDLDPSSVRVYISGRQIQGLSRTFHDTIPGVTLQHDGLPIVALIGSNGYLEVAVRDGNAAEALGIGVGAQVRVSFGS